MARKKIPSDTTGDFFFTVLIVLTVLTFLIVRVTNMGQIILLPLPKEGML
jgi:hypothetical protein